MATAPVERQRGDAFPPGWKHGQRPARQRHAARLERQPAGLGQRPHGSLAAPQEPHLDGLLQRERNSILFRVGQRFHGVRCIPLRDAHGHGREPLVLPH